MATIVETERISVEVADYEIQRQDWKDGKEDWRLCYVTPGYPHTGSSRRDYPCRYTGGELEDARERLILFRSRHPEITYRMVRHVTITEVVE